MVSLGKKFRYCEQVGLSTAVPSPFLIRLQRLNRLIKADATTSAVH